MDAYIKGFISGCCGVILSHPFDTAKTLIQENKQVPLSLTKLYRGLIPPLIGVGFEKSVVFGSYEFMKRKIDTKYTYVNTAVSGMFAGLSASFIVTPFERVKILRQNGALYKDVIGIRNMFRGVTATFTRETPGFGIYFTVYEAMKNKLYVDNNRFITPFGSFLIGALSGTVSWIFIYPQDRIKTKMQANNIGFLSAYNNVLKSGQMYKGFSFALMRAVPLHAGTFCVYECLKSVNMS